MGYGTGIEWCREFRDTAPIGRGATFNAWLGCQRVSPACQNCYAEADVLSKWGPGFWGPEKTSRRKLMADSTWKNPEAWHRRCERNGTRMIVFSNSESDVFELHRDITAARHRLFDLIERTPRLIWMLLTKRPEHIAHLVPSSWRGGVPANVWLGTSVETQHYAETRIPHLLETPAPLHFISNEPMLGPVDLTPWLDRLGWVLSGGESGPIAQIRATDLAWLRAVRDQCAAGGVPWFCKELGTLWARANGSIGKGNRMRDWPADLRLRQFPVDVIAALEIEHAR